MVRGEKGHKADAAVTLEKRPIVEGATACMEGGEQICAPFDLTAQVGRVDSVSRANYWDLQRGSGLRPKPCQLKKAPAALVVLERGMLV